MVVPAMDFIDETFTNGILNEKTLDPAIRTAIKLAKKTLNRYYGLTDASEVYRIAMGEYLTFVHLQRSDDLMDYLCSTAPPPQTRVFQESSMASVVVFNR